MSKKPLLPFWIFPYTWGTKGKTRATIQAEYELSGKDLDLTLLELNKDSLSDKEYQEKISKILFQYGDIDEHRYFCNLAELIDDPYSRDIAFAKLDYNGYDLKKTLLDIDLQHNKISNLQYDRAILKLDLDYDLIAESQYQREIIKLIKDPHQRKIAELELDLKDNNIDHNKYEKEMATLNKEPWIAVLNMSFLPEAPEEGAFELDWNEYFVESLKKSGYAGATDDELVNLWFLTVCKNVAMEEFGGVGTFDEDVEQNLSLQNGTKIYK